MGCSQLKSYTIGVEVFDLGASYDPQADSIVRTSTVRLRKMLNIFYSEEGKDESIRIVLGKGSYLPVFIHNSKKDNPGQTSRARILLAVEPLEWIGDETGLGYLSAGLAEELITNLSRYNENLISVLATNTKIIQQGLATENMKRFLNIYRLHGTLRRSEDELRIGFKLLDAGSCIVRWSETFVIRLSSTSLFHIQEQTARMVAVSLLDPHGIIYQSFKRKPAAVLGTYLAVYQYHEYQEHFTPETHIRARDALETAIRKEPDYADAWAALANVYLGEALFGFNQTEHLPSLTKKMLVTAQHAVALDPRNVLANYVLAMTHFYAKDKAQFLMVAEHALKLAPSRPDNLAVIGMHLLLAGQWERGLGFVENAMALNPFHPSWHYLVQSLYYLHGGRYTDALSSINRFAGLDFFPFQINLAVIHGYLGNQLEARKCLDHMFILYPAAEQNIEEILSFWFPFEDLAAIFTEGLKKAGFGTAIVNR